MSSSCKTKIFDPEVNYTIELPLAARIDEESASVTYQGWAKMGSSPRDPVWRIRKITTSGTETIITWANGNANFDNIWDQRANITYI